VSGISIDDPGISVSIGEVSLFSASSYLFLFSSLVALVVASFVGLFSVVASSEDVSLAYILVFSYFSISSLASISPIFFISRLFLSPLLLLSPPMLLLH
jgi:hypothetical protein